MFIKALPEYVMMHSYGVAKFMADWVMSHANCNLSPDEMYVLGLLHDIGKIYPSNLNTETGETLGNFYHNLYKGHAVKGGELLQDLGFHFAKEVMHHGHPEDAYFSTKLLLLDLADLSVNGKGEVIPIKERVDDVGFRYGQNSEEYKRCFKVIDKLISNGFLDNDWNIL